MVRGVLQLAEVRISAEERKTMKDPTVVYTADEWRARQEETEAKRRAEEKEALEKAKRRAEQEALEKAKRRAEEKEALEAKRRAEQEALEAKRRAEEERRAAELKAYRQKVLDEESQQQGLIAHTIRQAIDQADKLRSAQRNDVFAQSLQELKNVCADHRQRWTGRRLAAADTDAELHAVVTSIHKCTDELRARVLARLDGDQESDADTDSDVDAAGADALGDGNAEVAALCSRRGELVERVLPRIDRSIAQHNAAIQQLQAALDRLDDLLKTVTDAMDQTAESQPSDADAEDADEKAFVGLADGHPALVSFRRFCSSYLQTLKKASTLKTQLTSSLECDLAAGALISVDDEDKGATWSVWSQLEKEAASVARLHLMPAALDLQELCAQEMRRLTRGRRREAGAAVNEALQTRSLLESELRNSQQTVANMTADRQHWMALRDACHQKEACQQRLQDMQRRLRDLDNAILKCKFDISMAQRLKDKKGIKAETQQLSKLHSELRSLHSSKEMKWCRSAGTRLSRLLPELTEGVEYLSPLYGTGAEQLPLLDKTTDYADVELLAHGGVGNDAARHRVFRARLITSLPGADADAESKGDTGRLCVLKEFALSDSSESRRALRKSLHVMSRIDHPNVMTLEGVATETSLDSAVTDVGNGHVTHWYIQMPYMPKSLRQWMIDHKPPAAADSPKAWADWAVVCAPILRGIVSGLNALHAEGIVHRDIKPENVLMSEDNVPRLIDFETAFVDDTAAASSASASSATRGLMTATTGVALVRGTVGYMDPDLMHQLQATGEAKATPAVDMFAFGVLACEMLTGTRPKNPADVERMLPTALKQSYSTLLPLLKSLVNHHPSERPSQARVLLSDPFLQSAPATGTCCICYCDTPLANGVFCSSTTVPSHFSCDECFDGHVQSKCSESAGQLQGRNGQVPCYGDAKCTSAPFDDITVALHVTADTFKQHMAAHQRVVEARVSTELERKNEERLKEELERLARMDEAQRRVYAARRHIIEEILTLKCPRCKKVFFDFNGCFALTCQDDASEMGHIVGGTGGCGCGFCAWCLEDCGADAHRHVANCRYNVAPGRGVFASQALFEQAQRNRRRRLLDNYLGTLDAATRATVLRECEKDLKDLGLGDMK